MPVFLIIGAVGLGLVLATLILGEVLDGVFEAIDVDGGGGVLSTPVLGSFLAAFGFGGALTLYAADVGVPVATLSGLASGLAVGGVALLIVRSLMNMPTDENVRTIDLVGVTGTVITRVPPGGLGEVTVRHAGQLLKLAARSEEDLPGGTPIVVTAVLTSSSVLVEPVRRRPPSADPPPAEPPPPPQEPR